jgi:hypothetical protein
MCRFQIDDPRVRGEAVYRGLHVNNARAAPSGAAGGYTARRVSTAATERPPKQECFEQAAKRGIGDRQQRSDDADSRDGPSKQVRPAEWPRASNER